MPREDYGFFVHPTSMGLHSLYKMEQRILRTCTLNRDAVAAALGLASTAANGILQV